MNEKNDFQKESLFQLIKSLSKSEKRQFKLYANRLQSNSDTKFITLFKLLDNNLILLGGKENGLINGVYSLLESFGYRKYSADEPVIIPKATSFNMPKEEMKVPKIKYRTTNYYDARNEEYSAWHKHSSRDSWGLFVHTFEVLIPPDKYGKTHPEYFSLIDGERNPVTQLCLSNKDVFKTLVAD